MNKKGQKEIISFLIGLIIAIMIAVPVVLFVARFLEYNLGVEESFSELVNAVEGLDFDESVVVDYICSVNGGLVGFDKGEKEVVVMSNGDRPGMVPGAMPVHAPRLTSENIKCDKSACICLCSVSVGSEYCVVNECVEFSGIDKFEGVTSYDIKLEEENTEKLFFRCTENAELKLSIEKKKVNDWVVVEIKKRAYNLL